MASPDFSQRTEPPEVGAWRAILNAGLEESRCTWHRAPRGVSESAFHGPGHKLQGLLLQGTGEASQNGINSIHNTAVDVRGPGRMNSLSIPIPRGAAVSRPAQCAKCARRTRQCPHRRNLCAMRRYDHTGDVQRTQVACAEAASERVAPRGTPQPQTNADEVPQYDAMSTNAMEGCHGRAGVDTAGHHNWRSDGGNA